MSENRVLHALKGGGGSITGGLWAGSKAVISTSAGRVKVFEGQEEAKSFGAHAGEVAAVALHPSGEIVASIGVDKSYVLYDLTTSTVVTQVYSNSGMALTASMWSITNDAGQLSPVCNSILMVTYWLLGLRMDKSSCSMSRQERKPPLSTWTELSKHCISRRMEFGLQQLQNPHPLCQYGIYGRWLRSRVWTPEAGLNRSVGTTLVNSCSPEDLEV